MRTAHNRFSRPLIVGAIALAALLLTVLSFEWTTTWAGPSQDTSGTTPGTSPTGPQNVPGAPINVTATIQIGNSNGRAVVSWSAPSFTGTSAITNYRITSTPGSIQVTVGAVLTGEVTGLTNGLSYTFTVAAQNSSGFGDESAPSNAVTPYTIPGAPTIGVTTVGPGSGQLTVNWTAPANNGGSAITQYTATSNPSGITATANGAATSVVVSGLTAGTGYTFTVFATNAAGNGPPSAASNSATPVALPGAPTNVGGTPGNGQVNVTWVAPANTGGSAITSYRVTVSPAPNAGLAARPTGSAATSFVFTDLTNGAAYTFMVAATNAQGTGPDSLPSAGITPATVPGAPTGVAATPGSGQATVTWLAPGSNGGSVITSYTVIANVGGNPSGQTATWTFGPLTATVMGLTNTPPTAYTFTVKATNAAGTGPASAASGAVTPAAAPTKPDVAQIPAYTNQASITLSVTPFDAGTIRVKGGLATVNTAVVTAGAAQPVNVDLNLNTGNTLLVTVLNVNGIESAAETRGITHDNLKPVAATVSTPASPTKATTVTLDIVGETGGTIKVTGGLLLAGVQAIATGDHQNVNVGLKLNQTNNLSVTVTDQAGNVSDPTLRSLVQDLTPPATPAIIGAVTSPTNATQVIVNVGAENGSTITISGGLAVATGVGAGQANPVGVLVSLNRNVVNNLSVTATDAAGNVSGAATASVTQDDTEPSAPVVTGVVTPTKNNPVNLTIQAEGGTTITVTGGAAVANAVATGGSQVVPVTLNPNTQNNLAVTAKDAANNTSAATNVLIVHDNIAPIPNPPTVVFPGNTNQSSVNLTVTSELASTITITGGAAPVTAIGTGAAQVINYPLNPNSTNNLSVTAVDAAGNVTNAATGSVATSSVAPQPPTVSTPASPTNASSVTLLVTTTAGFTINISVTALGNTTNLPGIGATGAAQSIPVALTKDSSVAGVTNVISVTVTDTFNNTSAAVSRTVLSDTKPPAQPVITPALASLTNSTSITVAGTAEANSTITVTTLVNGGSTVFATVTGPVTGAGAYSVTASLQSNTSNVLRVIATDAAGNQSLSVSVGVDEDDIPPVLQVFNPLPASPTNVATVNFVVASEVGAGLNVTIGGLNIGTAAATGGIQNLAGGIPSANFNSSVQLSVTATDPAGNVSAPQVFTVVHDNIAPAAVTIAPAPPAQTTASEIALSVQAEPGSTIRVAGGSSIVTMTAVTPAGTTLVVTPLTANSTNSLSVTARDAAGNTSAPTNVSVARTPAVSQIRGKVITNVNLTGATASAVNGGTTVATGINPADGTFTLDNLNQQLPWTVSVTGGGLVANPPGCPCFFQSGAPGNFTANGANATGVTPGPTGSYVEISVLVQAVVTGLNGAGQNRSFQSDIDRTLTVSGTTLTGTTEIWLATGTTRVLLTGTTPVGDPATSQSATVTAGTPIGVYNVQVRTPAGLSAASANTLTITAAPALPQVTILSQTVVVRGTSPVMVVTGANFGGATNVTINPGGTASAPVNGSVTATSLQVVIPNTLATGTYRLAVTTVAGTGPASPSFDVNPAADASALTSATVSTSPVTVGAGGLAFGLTLSNEGVPAAPGASTAQATLSQGTVLKDVAGNAITDALLPPRPVTLPPGLPANSVGIKVGLPDKRVNLSVPAAIKLTMTGAAGGKAEQDANLPRVLAPTVYLQIQSLPAPVFEIAGMDTTIDGVHYLVGGTVLSETPIPGSNPAQSTYVMGFVTDHFSDFVGAQANLVPSTAPAVPANLLVTAVADAQVSLTWTAPANDGGSPVTGYRVTSTPARAGGPFVVGNVLAGTVTGLTNGTAYTFTVAATNNVGTGAESGTSAAATPFTTPGAPTGVSGSVGNAQSIVSWTAPASNGGSGITSYRLVTVPDSPNASAAAPLIVGNVTSATVTGLTNGTSYTVKVSAANVAGAGAAGTSSAFTPLSPALTPSAAPVNVVAVTGIGQAVITWTAPADQGGTPITGYRITSTPASPNSPLTVGNVTTATMTGLDANRSYQFTVAAINGAGASVQSAASTVVTLPPAPTNVAATAGSGSASVSWTVQSGAGALAITGYRIVSVPASPNSPFLTPTAATAATLTGLTNGTSYTLTVSAITSAGTGAESAPSNAVTPAAQVAGGGGGGVVGGGGGGGGGVIVPPAPPAPTGGSISSGGSAAGPAIVAAGGAAGQGLADAGAVNPVNAGAALLAAATLNPSQAAAALSVAITVNAQNTARLVVEAARTDVKTTVATLLAATSANPQALASLGQFLSAESFAHVQAACGAGGQCAAAWTVALTRAASLVDGQAAAATAAIDQVAVRLKAGVVGGRVTLDESATAPAGVTPPTGVVVNRYFTLTPTGFTNADVVSGQVTFRVSKSWVTANSIHPLSIQFARWDATSKVWVPVVANFQADLAADYQYLATVSGFSTWAVTGATSPQAPQFTVSNLTITPATVSSGQAVTITVDVQNTGAAAEYTATLFLNDVAEATQAVTIAAGQTQTVKFTVTKNTGTYSVRIDRLAGAFTVRPPTVPGGDLAPSGAVLAGVLAGGLLLMVAGGYILRRSSRRKAGA